MSRLGFFATPLNWLSQGAFCCPALEQSRSNHAGAPSQPLGPFDRGHSFAMMCQQPIGPRVPHLHGASRPSHIAMLIAARIIDAVERMLATWAWPNIAHELLKAIGPFLADGDASATVVWESFVARIQTAFFHGMPIVIGARVPHAMFAAHGADRFALQATTAACVPAPERIRTDNHLCSAGTSTSPLNAAERTAGICRTWPWQAAQNGQASYGMSRKIDVGHKGWPDVD